MTMDVPGALAPAAGPVTGPAMLDAMFPEGTAFRSSVRTYTIMLALAALIATFGLLEDSVAAIIGAMIVAPLGGAITGFAGALVTARSRWQWIDGLQVLLSALLVIGVGYAISWLLPDPLGLNPSLEARTAPGLLDLGVALAAGAAGAYVAVRGTGADALPGVAIAVSLVPPLATVGICLELGRIEDAGGALLLFLTNFAGIVVVACIVFVLCGAAPSRAMIRERHRVRNGMIGAVMLLIAISVPLAWRGIENVQATIRSTTGAPIVRDWIAGRNLTVTSWSIEGDAVTIALTGPDAPAPAAPLAASLAAAFSAPVDLEIVYVPSTQDRVTAIP
jgi:uncharacterized hydrophobic protein (TIGR00271 family)